MPKEHVIEEQLEAPMPWIGMYVAVASLICSFAMLADVFHGFRSKKRWFPCKYFSLNATSLTLLAVAMKLPVDLTTNMWAVTDRLAKISSLSLMSTAIGNFMPSIGSMSDKEILINVTALGILTITVIVDVCIQVLGMRRFLGHRVLFLEEIFAMILMLLLLVLLESSAIMVLTTKRYLEDKYQEMHNVALKQEFSDMGVATTYNKLAELVKKYWVMAETSCPQFVVARSVTCAASGVICLLNALVLGEAQIRMIVVHKKLSLTASSYGFSTNWILLAQIIGVLVGTIAPALRLFTTMSFWWSREGKRSLKEEFKIEDYWTKKLKEMKRSSLASRIKHHKLRQLIHNTKGLTLSFFVGLQIFVVISSKLVLSISSSITSPLIPFFKFIKHLGKRQLVDSVDQESGDYNMELSSQVKRHALRLDGEAELSENTLKSIYKEVDQVIKRGKKAKPESLLQLLQKSCNFKGVFEFDSNKVQSLNSKEPPNCWSLPVVTLTSIAIALPNVAKERVNQLISSVNEGLFCVKLIEKCLYENGELMDIRKAADIWVGVELFNKWQEINLSEISLKSRSSKEALQKLAYEGERIVSEFKKEVTDCLMKNPLKWPAEIIAANSMYRICKTILQSDEKDQDLFDKLTVMIADILAACLNNLTRVISKKCHLNAIEKRDKSVHDAAVLLGKTKEILEFLWRIKLPAGLDEEKAAYIDEWRSLIKLENQTPLCGRGMDDSESGGDYVAITVMK